MNLYIILAIFLFLGAIGIMMIVLSKIRQVESSIKTSFTELELQILNKQEVDKGKIKPLLVSKNKN